MSKVLNKLSLHIGSEISLNNFSFSQLIIEVKRMFDTDGIPGLVRVLVILIEPKKNCKKDRGVNLPAKSL